MAIINGTPGNDTLIGTFASDQINGLAGNDNLDGGLGNDTVDGGLDNDILNLSRDNDTLIGGDGIDSLRLEANNPVNGFASSFFLSNNQLVSNAFTWTLNGIERANLDAGTQNDFIDASAFRGSVTLNGGLGTDTLVGGANNDNLRGGFGNDLRIEGNAGNDRLSGDEGLDILRGGIGDDTLSGGEGTDLLDAGTGNDSLLGGTGDDDLRGGEGNDRLGNGGFGDDILDGGSGNDRFGYTISSLADGTDTIRGGTGIDSIEVNANDTIPNLTLTNSSLSRGTTHTLLDALEDIELNGSNGNNRIDALFYTNGAVEIDGFRGNDTLLGGSGSDDIGGQNGSDLLSGGGGNDTLNGFNFSDTPDFEFDTLTGGVGADLFVLSVKPGNNPSVLSYEGIGDARITDFSIIGGDRIQLKGAANQYNFTLENFGGLSTVSDTVIRSGSDLIAVVQDSNIIGANVINFI
jgi:Ca2+-binding RTX toxin-like protein